MAKPTQAHQRLLNENKNLRSRLEEAEETLRAIRSGQVDAFVITKAENIQTVPLEGADYPYRAMVESMNEGAVTLIPDGTIFFCNPRFAEMVQTPPEKLIGSPFQNLIAPDEQDAFVTLLTASRQVGAKGEFYLQPTTATRVPVQLSVRQLEAEDMKGISIVVTNLTERKYAEDAMRASEARFRALIEKSQDAIALSSSDGIILYSSPGAAQIVGATPETIVGHTVVLMESIQRIWSGRSKFSTPSRKIPVRAR